MRCWQDTARRTMYSFDATGERSLHRSERLGRLSLHTARTPHARLLREKRDEMESGGSYNFSTRDCNALSID